MGALYSTSFTDTSPELQDELEGGGLKGLRTVTRSHVDNKIGALHRSVMAM